MMCDDTVTFDVVREGENVIDEVYIDTGGLYILLGAGWSSTPQVFDVSALIAGEIPAITNASATRLQVTLSASLTASGSPPSNISLNNAEGRVFSVLGPGRSVPSPAPC